MHGRVFFWIAQLRERLWVKPLGYCVAAIGAVFAAWLADRIDHGLTVPLITSETIEKLLTIISSTMLAVATFAVGSLVSAYASASGSATPRAFALVVADGASQNSLSSFIGAFIFSIVAIIAVRTDVYQPTGQFVLFVLTLVIFAWVIGTFVRWVDNIARLGRVGNTIEKAEAAAMSMIEARCERPFLQGRPADPDAPLDGREVHAPEIGYICYIDMQQLQEVAERADAEIEILALPGSFMAPDRALAIASGPSGRIDDDTARAIAGAVVIGDNRTFEEDPRFGVVVLSEIAARALSPGVNDPGTAITIIDSMVRLLTRWAGRPRAAELSEPEFDRVRVPALRTEDLFDDAFTAIARDGAGTVEVGIRLQSAFRSLASLGNEEMRMEARRHAQQALRRFEAGLTLESDLERVAVHAEALGAQRSG